MGTANWLPWMLHRPPYSRALNWRRVQLRIFCSSRRGWLPVCRPGSCRLCFPAHLYGLRFLLRLPSGSPRSSGTLFLRNVRVLFFYLITEQLEVLNSCFELFLFFKIGEKKTLPVNSARYDVCRSECALFNQSSTPPFNPEDLRALTILPLKIHEKRRLW